jgi:hypothetical protein
MFYSILLTTSLLHPTHQYTCCSTQVPRFLIRRHRITRPSNLQVRIDQIHVAQDLVLDTKRMIDLHCKSPTSPRRRIVLTSNSDHSPPATRYVFHHCSGIVRLREDTKKLRSMDLSGLRWWFICTREYSPFTASRYALTCTRLNLSSCFQSSTTACVNDCACSYPSDPLSHSLAIRLFAHLRQPRIQQRHQADLPLQYIRRMSILPRQAPPADIREIQSSLFRSASISTSTSPKLAQTHILPNQGIWRHPQLSPKRLSRLVVIMKVPLGSFFEPIS